MVEEIRPTNVIYGTDSKTQYTCQGNICNNNNNNNNNNANLHTGLGQ